MLQICYSGNAKHSGKVAYLPMSDLWSISTPPKNIAKSLILMFQIVSKGNIGMKWVINPFFPSAPFLYPMKTSENRKG